MGMLYPPMLKPIHWPPFAYPAGRTWQGIPILIMGGYEQARREARDWT
jgi:hypothetical protein